MPPRTIAVAPGIGLRCWIAGRGPPVLLLHGFANTATLNWRLTGVLADFARSFQTIAIDQRGHGGSSKPRDPQAYGIELVNDIARILDALGYERAHLVGISLGGFVALKAACVLPQRLRSVVLLGAGWKDPAETAFAEALEHLADSLDRGRGIPPIAAFFGGDRPPPTALHKALVWSLTRFLAHKQATAALVRSLGALAVSEDELRSLAVPVCAIVGSRDPFVVDVRALAARAPQAETTIVPGAGHLDLLFRRAVRRRVTAFLQRHS